MSQAIEVFATLRADTDRFGSEARRGIAGAMPGIAKAAAAGMAVVGAAIAATAVKSVQAFAGFERQMNEVFTLLPGISKTAMDAMSDQALALAKDMGTLPEEIVPALYQALSAGVPQDNVFAFLETANQAAIGGITDIETSVNAITGVVNAYGADVISATEASDLMFTTVRLGKTTFGELAGSLANVLPFAAAANVNFENISAAMATMTFVTGRTSESTTALRQLIVELADSAKGVGETFEEVAGKSFKDFMAEGGSMQDALILLAEHAGDTGLSIDQLFSSVEAGGAALILTGAASDSFTEALAEMGTSAGATEAAYAQMDQGLSRAMDRLKAGWEVIKIQIGEHLAPLVEEFATWIINNMPAIEAAIGEAMVAIETWIRDTAIPAFQSMLTWWDENGEEVLGWFDAITASFGTTSAGYTTAVDTMDTDSARLRGVFATTTESITGETETSWEKFQRLDAQFAETLANANNTVNQWGRNIRKAVIDAYNWFAEGIEMFRVEIARYVENVRNAALRVGQFFSNLATTVGTAMGDMFTAVKNKGGELINWFKRLPGKIASAVGSLATTLLDKGKELIGGFVRGIRDAIPGIGDAVGDAMGSASQARASSAGVSSRGPGGGGAAMAKAERAMAGLPLRFSSTYRSPAHNRRVGGAPNSLHMDRANPAVDIVGPTWALDAVAARLRPTPHRELLWRVPNHAPGDNPHVHYAHFGGMVSANWPTLPGLKNDERPAVLQIGEKITPKGRGDEPVVLNLTLMMDAQQVAKATGRYTMEELRQIQMSLS